MMFLKKLERSDSQKSLVVFATGFFLSNPLLVFSTASPLFSPHPFSNQPPAPGISRKSPSAPVNQAPLGSIHLAEFASTIPSPNEDLPHIWRSTHPPRAFALEHRQRPNLPAVATSDRVRDAESVRWHNEPLGYEHVGFLGTVPWPCSGARSYWSETSSHLPFPRSQLDCAPPRCAENISAKPPVAPT